VPPVDRADFVANLDEGFAVRQERDGRGAALRWMLRQLATSPIPLIRHRLHQVSRRDARSRATGRWIDLADDLRLAARLARRHRLTSATVVCTMVLGIAVTTAVFSVVNGVLLRPLPFPDSERVVQFGSTMRTGDSTRQLSVPDVEDFRRGATGFSAITTAIVSGFTLTHGDAPQQLLTGRVDSTFARVFSLRLQLGRYFVDEEFQQGNHRVAILTDAVWAATFGRDPAIVGRSIPIGGEPWEVVGVLAAGTYLWPSPELKLLTPLILPPDALRSNRGAPWLNVAGKLRDGVTIEAGREEILRINASLTRAYPAEKEGTTIQVERLHDEVVGEVRLTLYLLSAAVGAVLLIVCVNVANVLLVQSSARSREFSLRAALGGSRARLRRQLLTESMLLAMTGGLVATALAPLLTRVLVSLYPGTLPRGDEARVDLPVLGVTLLVTIIAGMLSGWPTVRRAGAVDLSRGLTGGGRTTQSAGERRVSRGLLVAQVAVSLALLFSAGLLVRTFNAVSATDTGYRTSQLLTCVIPTPGHTDASIRNWSDRSAPFPA
jgi:putative ABC transport system permease protein